MLYIVGGNIGYYRYFIGIFIIFDKIGNSFISLVILCLGVLNIDVIVLGLVWNITEVILLYIDCEKERWDMLE